MPDQTFALFKIHYPMPQPNSVKLGILDSAKIMSAADDNEKKHLELRMSQLISKNLHYFQTKPRRPFMKLIVVSINQNKFPTQLRTKHESRVKIQNLGMAQGRHGK